MEKFYADLIAKYRDLYKSCDKAMPGSNGPYFRKETYARNTAHWIITFSYMYWKTKDKVYKSIVSRFAKSLIEEIEASKNGVIRCFASGEKTSVNGLIGFAWIIEGLTAAYAVLHDKAIIDAAEKLYFSQPYNRRLHTWEIVDIDGINLGTDIAFNHSLWFCLAAAKVLQIRENPTIEWHVRDYIENVGKHFMIYRSGLISHFDIHSDRWLFNVKKKITKVICSVTRSGIPLKKWNYVEYERAYHLFSVYAFAWLYHFYPSADFFKSPKFHKLKSYGLYMNHFVSFPQMNSYAYGYNSPAYEFPFVNLIFGEEGKQKIDEKCLEVHAKYNIDSLTGMYTSNVPDEETLNARIYEIVQYYWLKETYDEKK